MMGERRDTERRVMGTENAFVGDIEDLPHPLDLLDAAARRRAEEEPGILVLFDFMRSPAPMPKAREAAAIAGYVTWKFRRRFEDVVGLAYRRFLVRYKVVLGPALIARGVPYPIVARWLGFGDPRSVRGLMARELNRSPSTFRQP